MPSWDKYLPLSHICTRKSEGCEEEMELKLGEKIRKRGNCTEGETGSERERVYSLNTHDEK